MATSRRTWKEFEKKIAERLGVKRVSKAKLGEGVEDVRGGINIKEQRILISGECKFRAKLPIIIRKSFEQALENSPSKRHMPVVFIKEKFTDYDDTYVVIKLKDFEKLLD